jgi:hypothetical protein
MRLPLLAVILLSIPVSSFSQNGDNLFNSSVIHEIRMYSNDPDLWQDLLTHYNESQAGAENVYNPVDIIIDGTSLSSVGLRIKGFSSAWGSDIKKPFRIDFDEFVTDQKYDGLKKISLNNALWDPSCMRDVIAYNILRFEGVAASRTSYAKVYINDQYWGLYIVAEQIDKTFLKQAFGDNDGNLYKCIGWSHLTYVSDSKDDYKQSIELKTNETQDDWTNFIDFVRYLNKIDISDEEYRTVFPEKFDIPHYLKILAVDILINNWDSYYDHGRNYYIYDNPVNNKMTWIPWDYNLSFSATPINILASNPMSQIPKPLIRNLLDDPEMVKLLVKTYQEILTNNFTSDRLVPLINQTRDLIKEEVANDPNYHLTPEQFNASLEETKVIHHEDTVVIQYDVNHICFVKDWSNPDCEDGKILLDTTQFLYTRFDTLDFGGGPMVFLYTKQVWIYDETVIGLKGFIRQRITEVNNEIAELGFVTDIEPLVAQEDFVIFPNPVNRNINFSGRIAGQPFDIVVYDAAGKKMPLCLDGGMMDVKGLAPGAYFAEVKSPLGNLKRKFFKVGAVE